MLYSSSERQHLVADDVLALRLVLGLLVDRGLQEEVGDVVSEGVATRLWAPPLGRAPSSAQEAC